jgi:hypothetical protein
MADFPDERCLKLLSSEIVQTLLSFISTGKRSGKHEEASYGNNNLRNMIFTEAQKRRWNNVQQEYVTKPAYYIGRREAVTDELERIWKEGTLA